LQNIAPYTEALSLILILASFVVIAYLAFRVRTVHSFQFEMFLFMLVLAVAEIPRILETLGVFADGPYDLLGLEVHSVSMVILVAFVAIRVYRFWRGKDT
jgi:E3 ubiquitin-protein ligase DOA10